MDKNYWESFYLNQNADLKPSLFAKYIVENIAGQRTTLIELGCGNGRDAVFFANEGLTVRAIDQCASEIDFLKNSHQNLPTIQFIQGDFTNMEDGKNFDLIYSRFTLHSVSGKQQEKVTRWAYSNLNPQGRFCIEVRGHKNEIYGIGEPVEGEKDAFIYEGHYRRFIKLTSLCKDLEDVGFQLKIAEEKKGFAPYKNKNEVFIRVIAQK